MTNTESFPHKTSSLREFLVKPMQATMTTKAAEATIVTQEIAQAPTGTFTEESSSDQCDEGNEQLVQKKANPYMKYRLVKP